ncbi:Hypp133 [Branchiostoma lanceolatum]|uniref:Hypp133 protein n=1 Tax=Branchiostoma lanceolatum TaxID=7740 RepID=A0A8J9WBN5_BRALA|nr:Hypp133 [Branchiostoma lanceolatum]
MPHGQDKGKDGRGLISRLFHSSLHPSLPKPHYFCRFLTTTPVLPRLIQLDTLKKIEPRKCFKGTQHKQKLPMDNTVREEELDYVAVRVRPSESRRLLRKLGLNDVTIEQVFHDFEKAGSREQLYQGLLQCKEMTGSGFTLGELVNTLEIIGRADLAENLSAEMLDLPPGENKVLVKVTVKSKVNKFEMSTSFIGSEDDAKSIQSEILENLAKRRSDRCGSHVLQAHGHGLVKHFPNKTLK